MACDFYTSTEYSDNGVYQIRWMTFPDGTAIELTRWRI